MLTEAGCRARQQRLRELLNRLNADAVAITDLHEIYYFTGVLLTSATYALPGFFWLDAQGRTFLVAPQGREGGWVTDRLEYAWSEGSTANPDNVQRVNAQVGQHLKGVKASRIAFQAEAMPRSLADAIAGAASPDHWLTIDGDLVEMEKRKDPDEIEIIRRCVQANLAGYTAARALIAPGVNELEVLAAAQRAAELSAGEPVYHGGDFRSGAGGGPARNRQIERGELYIVDAQTYYAGYWSDLSRAYIVGDEPTPFQQALFDHVAAIHQHVPALFKPGVDGRDIWRETDRLIRELPALAEIGLTHHAGHNVGLHAHEQPDLNPDRGGVLEVGNVVTFEPGAYPTEARGGVRLENMYLITETGEENLAEYPMALR